MGNLKKLVLKAYNNEGIRYLFVGGCTTLFNIFVFWLCNEIFEITVTTSNFISIILAIIFAYITNKIIVFRSKTNNLKDTISELIKFIAARGATMVIELAGVFILVNIIGIYALLGKVITQIIVIICNYILSKLLVFK